MTSKTRTFSELMETDVCFGVENDLGEGSKKKGRVLMDDPPPPPLLHKGQVEEMQIEGKQVKGNKKYSCPEICLMNHDSPECPSSSNVPTNLIHESEEEPSHTSGTKSHSNGDAKEDEEFEVGDSSLMAEAKEGVSDLFRQEQNYEVRKKIPTINRLVQCEVQLPKLKKILREVFIWMSSVIEESSSKSMTTLHCAVDYFEQYISAFTPFVPDLKILQLIACDCILIAFKREETEDDAPNVDKMRELSVFQYTKQQFIDTEVRILNMLEWELQSVSPAHFMQYFLLCSLDSTEEKLPNASQVRNDIRNYCSFFMTLCTLEREIYKKFHASEIAAAALYVARQKLLLPEVWPKHLIHLTQYSKQDLESCSSCLLEYIPDGTTAPSNNNNNNNTSN